ncbi:PREDICTED: uncharacterized protein LOC109219710 [Nicotiana attenuata]|uniref:IST1-like protein n=1 Tax=Nicotiana attenuata TaxID=49451 RepID=A0A1J6KFX3_NICAT|nr:PREDICTED: uncharacterized protein LOC109219710 [Nicotiana attenuata]OIT20799.1 hypothetical protein A4A49_37438 [Nicotiana attenuata]
MTAASVATKHCKKAVKMGLSLFCRTFNSSKCKTMAKMAVARIKLLRNKREVVVRQMRRDIAMLLESRQDATARIRVEHVIREQNILQANEFLELFCELIVARLPIIAKQKECPADLKEGISSLIFAAPRCSDIPELMRIKDVFEKKYGKDFVSAATDLRPNAGVNRALIEKLSVKTPSGEVKLKIMKEIAKEYQVDWDTAESEVELLKPPEERIDGPNGFVSATSLPLKPTPMQPAEPNNLPRNSKQPAETNYLPRASDDGESKVTIFDDPASAAKAAAESAKQAIAAAEAAAYLASKDAKASTGRHHSMNNATVDNIPFVSGAPVPKFSRNDVAPTSQSIVDLYDDHWSKNMRNPEHTHGSSGEEVPIDMKRSQKFYRRHSYNVPSSNSDVKYDDDSDCDEEIEMEDPPIGNTYQHSPPTDANGGKFYRRHSYNVPSSRSGIKFDESDGDEEIETEEATTGSNRAPNRPAPQVPRVHPKLPDYDTLAARFESLNSRNSRR